MQAQEGDSQCNLIRFLDFKLLLDLYKKVSIWLKERILWWNSKAAMYVPSNGAPYEDVLCYENQFWDLDLASMCLCAVHGGWFGKKLENALINLSRS